VNKIELDKLRTEKKEIETLTRKYYETSYFLNIQLHKQSLINERLSNLIKNSFEEIKDEDVVTRKLF
jgi:molybdopterin converting factor small subunit